MVKYLSVFACLLLLGCGNSPSSQSSDYTVKYEVNGTEGIKRANISYQDKDGELTFDQGASLPWSLTFTREEGSYVSVSATMIGTGTITAQIDKNGDMLDRNSSSDPENPAVASGYL